MPGQKLVSFPKLAIGEGLTIKLTGKEVPSHPGTEGVTVYCPACANCTFGIEIVEPLNVKPFGPVHEYDSPDTGTTPKLALSLEQ